MTYDASASHEDPASDVEAVGETSGDDGQVVLIWSQEIRLEESPRYCPALKDHRHREADAPTGRLDLGVVVQINSPDILDVADVENDI